MKTGSNKKKLLIFVVLGIGCTGMYYTGTHIFGAKSYSFSLDPQLSMAMHGAIKKTVHESYCGSLASLAAALNNACLAASEIALERCGNNVLHITCNAQAPYLCLADQMVLLKNSAVVPKECFTELALRDIPVVSVKNMQCGLLSSEFKQWLLQLDGAMLEAYSICWVDDYEIYVTDKQDAHAAIVCSIDTVIDTNMREKCQHIIKEKIMNAQGTARLAFYNADIRFEKQIILYSQKGGALHG